MHSFRSNKSKFEISKDYAIRLKRYWGLKFWVCGKDSIPFLIIKKKYQKISTKVLNFKSDKSLNTWLKNKTKEK